MDVATSFAISAINFVITISLQRNCGQNYENEIVVINQNFPLMYKIRNYKQTIQQEFDTSRYASQTE